MPEPPRQKAQPPLSRMPAARGVPVVPPGEREKNEKRGKKPEAGHRAKRAANASPAARDRLTGTTSKAGSPCQAGSACPPPPKPASKVPHFILQAHEVRRLRSRFRRLQRRLRSRSRSRRWLRSRSRGRRRRRSRSSTPQQASAAASSQQTTAAARRSSRSRSARRGLDKTASESFLGDYFGDSKLWLASRDAESRKAAVAQNYARLRAHERRRH